MSNAPDKLFDAISLFITESRTLLDQGAMNELAGLDDHVRTLCDAVMQLSAEERKQYAKKLEQLFAELTLLGDKLTVARDSVGEQLQHVAQHRKALNAYKVADSRDKEKGRVMDTIDPIRFMLAFIFVIGLIGVMAWLMKRYGKTTMLGMKQEGDRLEVLEVRWLDPKRRLVLVRRDDAEHFLLLADGRELVIESNIRKDADA